MGKALAKPIINVTGAMGFALLYPAYELFMTGGEAFL